MHKAYLVLPRVFTKGTKSIPVFAKQVAFVTQVVCTTQIKTTIFRP